MATSCHWACVNGLQLVQQPLQSEAEVEPPLMETSRFEEKMVMHGFTVHARCADGYKGAAAVAKCGKANEPYTLSGCSPVRCVEPSDTDRAAYDLTVFSAETPSFSVLAKCKSGVGAAKASACSEDGQPYVLEGCPSLCTSPKKTTEDGYVVLLVCFCKLCLKY